jgi:hypothetical protein
LEETFYEERLGAEQICAQLNICAKATDADIAAKAKEAVAYYQPQTTPPYLPRHISMS